MSEELNQATEKSSKVKDATQAVTRRASITGELFRFLWKQKLWWMIPLVIVLLLVGIAFIFLQSAIAPFIYTIV